MYLPALGLVLQLVRVRHQAVEQARRGDEHERGGDGSPGAEAGQARPAAAPRAELQLVVRELALRPRGRGLRGLLEEALAAVGRVAKLRAELRPLCDGGHRQDLWLILCHSIYHHHYYYHHHYCYYYCYYHC